MITKDELKNRIDFAFFCAHDSFLNSGSFVPMLDITFKNSKGESTRAVVALMGEAIDDRLKILYSFGAIFGSQKNNGKVQEIENILMINEAWMSKHNKNVKKEDVPMPSKDPNRSEGLVCVGQTPEGLCLMKGKEIKRVLAGDKFNVELVEVNEGLDNYSEAESNLLQKFYDGFNGVVSKGIIFKDEDMPINNSLKELFK